MLQGFERHRDQIVPVLGREHQRITTQLNNGSQNLPGTESLELGQLLEEGRLCNSTPYSEQRQHSTNHEGASDRRAFDLLHEEHLLALAARRVARSSRKRNAAGTEHPAASHLRNPVRCRSDIYQRGQLFRDSVRLVTGAAIACPYQVADGTWSRQWITSFQKVLATGVNIRPCQSEHVVCQIDASFPTGPLDHWQSTDFRWTRPASKP